MAIRENIIKLREMNQITQEQLAKIAGVSRGAVSQWEGGFSEPRMGAIQRMADHFNISKSNIIEDGGMNACYRSSIPEAMKAISNSESYLPLVSLGRVHAGVLVDEEVCEKTQNVELNIHVQDIENEQTSTANPGCGSLVFTALMVIFAISSLMNIPKYLAAFFQLNGLL